MGFTTHSISTKVRKKMQEQLSYFKKKKNCLNINSNQAGSHNLTYDLRVNQKLKFSGSHKNKQSYFTVTNEYLQRQQCDKATGILSGRHPVVWASVCHLQRITLSDGFNREKKIMKFIWWEVNAQTHLIFLENLKRHLVLMYQNPKKIFFLRV